MVAWCQAQVDCVTLRQRVSPQHGACKQLFSCSPSAWPMSLQLASQRLMWMNVMATTKHAMQSHASIWSVD